jgi:uncharacterized protein YdaU (DUF1376 family)
VVALNAIPRLIYFLLLLYYYVATTRVPANVELKYLIGSYCLRRTSDAEANKVDIRNNLRNPIEKSD